MAVLFFMSGGIVLKNLLCVKYIYTPILFRKKIANKKVESA